jgi:hypothetical protein
MSVRVRVANAALLATVGVVAFACLGGVASATQVHVYTHTLGAGALALTPESGMDINQETGEIYVSDTSHSRIAKFTAAGAADGSLATVAEPTAIAVDNSAGPSKGDVYVVGEGGKTIFKLSPAGLPVTSWGTNGQQAESEENIGITVDSEGNLWVLSHHLVLTTVETQFQKVGAPKEDTVTARVFDQAGTRIGGRGWTTVYGGPYYALPSELAVDAAGDLYMLSEIQITLNVPVRGERRPAIDRYTRDAQKLGAAGELLLDHFNAEGSKLNLGISLDRSAGRAYFGAVTQVEGNVDPRGEEPANLLAMSLEGSRLEHFGGDYEGPIYRAHSSIDNLYDIASIAVSENSHAVYVADPHEKNIAVYELEEVAPPTVTIEPPGAVAQHSAKLTASIDPNAPAGSTHAHDVSWYVECTPGCPGHSQFTAEYIEADGHAHPVETTLEGLEAGTEYSVTLVARSRGGNVERAVSFSTAPDAPAVTDEPPSEVVHGEASLRARISPSGAETTYHFEYMTKAAYDAEGGFAGPDVQRTAESEPIEGKSVFHQISLRVAGLEPGSDYVYRAVASNSVGTTDGEAVFFRSQIGSNALETDCPNQLLRTEAGARLPDCRAYELVSPAEKNGNVVEPFPDGLQAADDGSSVTWFTGQAATGVPSPQGAHQEYAFYVSSLAGEAWATQRLLAPEQLGKRSAFVGLTADGRYALLQTGSLHTSTGSGQSEQPGVTEPGLYLLDTTTHALTPIVSPQAGQVTRARSFTLDGANAGDSLIFFESRLQLTSNATAEKNNLYMWDRVTGVLSLAGVLPGAKSEAPAGGSFGGAYSWWGAPNLNTGGSEEALYVDSTHAISPSGDAVYFTAGETGQLYFRHGLTGTKPTTVRVSAANPGVTDPNGQRPAAFQEATPDGGKAFFLSSGKLTENANTGTSDEGTDLYRYDTETKALVDVTPDPAGAGAQVQGLLGVAEDGRSGYLVAKGALAGGVEGQSNLYHFEEAPGSKFAYKLVATLSPVSGTRTYERDWSPTSNEARLARVSKDGQTVLFMSQRDLTGTPLGECTRGACMEAYRYSMSEGALACLSCNPTGEGARISGAELSATSEKPLDLDNRVRANPGTAVNGALPDNLSASGTRVFFDSPEALLPEAVNGTEPSTNCTNPETCGNVYEWEAVGTGSCRTPNHAGGCLFLLSTGESEQSSSFVNASADGTSVFMITGSQLVPADKDQLADVYDVREDGGLAAQHASALEPCGSVEACRGSASPLSPIIPTGSSIFTGLGNLLDAPPVPPAPKPKPKPKPKQCKRGLVHKHRKCVKPPRHHKKKPLKHKAHARSATTGQTRSGGVK